MKPYKKYVNKYETPHVSTGYAQSRVSLAAALCTTSTLQVNEGGKAHPLSPVEPKF